jgi:hypothetical protein
MRKGREPIGTLIITDDGWKEFKQGYVQHGDHVAINCVVQKYRDLFNTELSSAVQTASLVAVY